MLKIKSIKNVATGETVPTISSDWVVKSVHLVSIPRTESHEGSIEERLAVALSDWKVTLTFSYEKDTFSAEGICSSSFPLEATINAMELLDSLHFRYDYKDFLTPKLESNGEVNLYFS